MQSFPRGRSGYLEFSELSSRVTQNGHLGECVEAGSDHWRHSGQHAPVPSHPFLTVSCFRGSSHGAAGCRALITPAFTAVRGTKETSPPTPQGQSSRGTDGEDKLRPRRSCACPVPFLVQIWEPCPSAPCSHSGTLSPLPNPPSLPIPAKEERDEVCKGECRMSLLVIRCKAGVSGCSGSC